MKNAKLMLITSAFGFAMSAPALAQEADADSDRADPEATDIVVTAQKREERVQDVPVAVAVFSDEDRDLMGLATANDVAKMTPGLEFNLNRAVIRGIGRTTNALGTDPGVATYYDGFYAADAGSIGGPTIITERIEILRGPQGTLYGRNSIGGAINVISKRPSPTLEAEFRQRVGNFDTFETSATVTGPIADWLRFRATGNYIKQAQGFVKNVTGPDRNDQDKISVSVQLEADLTDDLSLWLSATKGGWDQRIMLGVLVDPYDTNSARLNALIPNVLRGYTATNPTVSDRFVVDEDHASSIRLYDAPSITTHLTWDLGGATLKYIAGALTYKTELSYDFDNSSRVGFTGSTGTFISSQLVTRAGTDYTQWSNELNLASNGTGPFSWILGLYHYSDDMTQTTNISAPDQPELLTPLTLPTFTPIANPGGDYIGVETNLRSTSYAMFGQFDYELSSKFTMSAGLRYTWDKKTGTDSRWTVYFDPEGTGLLAGSIGPTVGYSILLGDDTLTRTDKWDDYTAKLGLEWRPISDLLAYAAISRGYKSGGFNLGALDPNPVDPEHINAIEVGMKSNFSSSLQLNASSYYYWYKDIQVVGNVSVDGVPTPSLFNAPKARSYGVEVETVWKPTQNLKFSLNYAYLNAKFSDFATGIQDPAEPELGFQDLTGNSLPQSPRNKLSFNTLYTIEFDPGSLSLSGTYVWTDKQYYSVFSTPIYEGRAHDEADFRITWTDANDRFSLIAYMQNAFDEVYTTNVGLSPSSIGRVWQLAPPRTFGAEVQFRF